jgi:hypothetical protein
MFLLAELPFCRETFRVQSDLKLGNKAESKRLGSLQHSARQDCVLKIDGPYPECS